MSTPRSDAAAPIDLTKLGVVERAQALARACSALRDPLACVVAMGDTGPLIIAAVGSTAARTLVGPGVMSAWLAPNIAAAKQAMIIPRLAQRVLHALAPGPAVFRVGLDEQSLMRFRIERRTGELPQLEPGVCDDGVAVTFRICGESVANDLAARSDVDLIAYEPTDLHPSIDAAAALARAKGLNIVGIFAHPTDRPAAGPASVIAIDRRGTVRVESEGAYKERYVLKHAGLNVLLVCTGNTCRSPMAEAIALGLAERLGLAGMRFSSAGTGAINGAPPTPEGVQAVREMGYTAHPGGSRVLTARLIRDADVIYTMTRSHAHGVLHLDPSAAGKVHLLDPAGQEVPDPIGLPQAAYTDVAHRLERMIEARLKELST